MERWARPVVPLDISQHDTEGIWLPDGRNQRQVVLTLKPDDVERMRTGFVCAKCLQPFEEAWPERCPVCGAPIRTKQAEYFAREFNPAVVDLSPTDWEAERDSIEEHRRKEEESRGNGSDDPLG